MVSELVSEDRIHFISIWQPGQIGGSSSSSDRLSLSTTAPQLSSYPMALAYLRHWQNQLGSHNGAHSQDVLSEVSKVLRSKLLRSCSSASSRYSSAASRSVFFIASSTV